MEAILYFTNISIFKITPNRVLCVARHISIAFKSFTNFENIQNQPELFSNYQRNQTENWKRKEEEEK
jgi:hypothetical protein